MARLLAGKIYRILKVVYIALIAKFGLGICLLASPNTFDTSSRLLLAEESDSHWILKEIAARSLAWDTVYFTALAKHGGQRFEHEFAFSNTWANLITLFSPYKTLVSLTLTAAVLSTVAHILACIVLVYLTNSRQLRGIDPVNAAIIYTLCPAGIFLNSGYAESFFALLSFVGLLLFNNYALFSLSGVVFALSVLLRTNGLLWGALFATCLLGELLRKKWHLFTICDLVLGGSLIFLAFFWPQYKMYQSLCPGLHWCSLNIPSIYGYVQTHYWNNGFLRYWTVANSPNFLLASPTLILLALSSRFLYKRHLLGLALVQSLAMVGAIFFWNVQIITRLASCFPGPYWYLSSLLAGTNQQRRQAKVWVCIFIVWNATQTVLYGAFLPPA